MKSSYRPRMFCVPFLLVLVLMSLSLTVIFNLLIPFHPPSAVVPKTTFRSNAKNVRQSGCPPVYADHNCDCTDTTIDCLIHNGARPFKEFPIINVTEETQSIKFL